MKPKLRADGSIINPLDPLDKKGKNPNPSLAKIEQGLLEEWYDELPFYKRCV